jgi:uncharacterized protein YbjT (DUF2867 family)
MRIAIFPAAGGLGGATLSHLINTTEVEASSVTLISRHPEKLEKEKNQGATLRKADFDELETLDGAFEGVDVLNLISYPSFTHEHRYKVSSLLLPHVLCISVLILNMMSVQVAKAAIDAAVASGVKHIFYSSLAFARDGPPTYRPHVMLAHLDTEAYLAKLASSRFSYTIVRQGLYTESFPVYTANFDLKAAREKKDQVLKIRIPHDGSGPGISWAKRDELGEATARLLAEHARDPSNFRFNNKLIILSGPKEYTLKDTASIFSNITGKTVQIEEVSVDEYASQPEVGYGSDSEQLNKLWATAFEGIKHAEAATVTTHLAELLGREPEDAETTLRKMISA